MSPHKLAIVSVTVFVDLWSLQNHDRIYEKHKEYALKQHTHIGMCARRYGGGDGVTFLDPAGLQRR